MPRVQPAADAMSAEAMDAADAGAAAAGGGEAAGIEPAEAAASRAEAVPDSADHDGEHSGRGVDSAAGVAATADKDGGELGSATREVEEAAKTALPADDHTAQGTLPAERGDAEGPKQDSKPGDEETPQAPRISHKRITEKEKQRLKKLEEDKARRAEARRQAEEAELQRKREEAEELRLQKEEADRNTDFVYRYPSSTLLVHAWPCAASSCTLTAVQGYRVSVVALTMEVTAAQRRARRSGTPGWHGPRFVQSDRAGV